jgi:phosphatidylglycerol lysyltransferase
MKRIWHILGRLLILAIFICAAWLLYHLLQEPEYSWPNIRNALGNISARQIASAVFLTVINYIILIGYDWLAVRLVGEDSLPLRKIALASFTGYAFSYNFGATLFGSGIRYRLYSAWGMRTLKILNLLLILGLTFWFGVFTLAGVVFVALPFPLPAELVRDLKLPFQDTFWIGVALLLLAVGYVAIIALRRKPLILFGWQIPTPPLKLTLYQIAIACADLLVAAAVLHALLPPIEGGYMRVLGVFMLAFVVAVVTHVPGGYGIFDLTILHFMTKAQKPEVVAGLLVFRVIYYWLPLLIAALVLGYHELTLTRETEMTRTLPDPAAMPSSPEAESQSFSE